MFLFVELVELQKQKVGKYFIIALTTCRRVITSNDIHEPCLSSCKPQLLLLIFSSHHDALEIASNKISQPELLLCFLWKTIKWCQNPRTQHQYFYKRELAGATRRHIVLNAKQRSEKTIHKLVT